MKGDASRSRAATKPPSHPRQAVLLMTFWTANRCLGVYGAPERALANLVEAGAWAERLPWAKPLTA